MEEEKEEEEEEEEEGITGQIEFEIGIQSNPTFQFHFLLILINLN